MEELEAVRLDRICWKAVRLEEDIVVEGFG